MIFPLAQFTAFAGALMIPSKEAGLVPLTLIGTQRFLLAQIARGLAEGIHDFVILKGRQLGYSTVTLALTLWWHLNHLGIQGLIVNDSDYNHSYFRDVLRAMLVSLPTEYRLPVDVDNDDMLRWAVVSRRDGSTIGGSRLNYQVAGSTKRKQGKLGRGQGINFLLGDELDYWTHTKDIQSLGDTMAERHPLRLSLKGSTANGYGVLYDLWNEAEHAVTTRRIFVGSWLSEEHRVAKGSAEYRRYGSKTLSADERIAVNEVRRRYRVAVPHEHIAWRRYRLAEKYKGDDAMLSQEHPWLPEEAFQSAGSKFIRPATIQRLRRDAAKATPPQYFRYAWGQRLNDCPDPEPCAPNESTLSVWEEPVKEGAYLVGVVAMGSHDADSTEHAITVWRIYPDWIVQVAEYLSEEDATYQLAWAMLHLCGAYNQYTPPFLALELQGTGRRVYEELDRFMNTGFGLSETVRGSQRGLCDFVGNVRHYLYRRADSLTRTAARQWQGTNTLGTVLMHELRDQVERGYLEIRSNRLITELATLRQGGEGDGDQIEAGGRASDCLAVSAAIAIRHYVETAFPEIETLIPAKDGPGPVVPVEQALFQHYLSTAMSGPSRVMLTER